MDKYLSLFTDQLDTAFEPATLFPDKKIHFTGWLKRSFTIRKKGEQQPEIKCTKKEQQS